MRSSLHVNANKDTPTHLDSHIHIHDCARTQTYAHTGGISVKQRGAQNKSREKHANLAAQSDQSINEEARPQHCRLTMGTIFSPVGCASACVSRNIYITKENIVYIFDQI